MSKQISVVNVATDTFTTWIGRVNEVITTVNTEVITANSSPSGALTTGNSYLIGIFSSNLISANSGIRGGNVSHSAPLNVFSNLALNNFSISISNSLSNVIITTNSLTIANSTKSSVFSLGGVAFGNSTVNTNIYSNGSLEVANNSLLVKTSATANAVINSSSFKVSNATQSATLSLLGFSFGNSTVNASLTVSDFILGTVQANTSALFVGNSTVKSILTNFSISTPNSISVGTNAVINTTSINIGNTTVRTFANATNIITTDIDTTIANIVSATIDVLTVNSILTGTGFVVGNSAIYPTYFTTGNSTVNASINSTSISISNTSGVFQVSFEAGISNSNFNSKFLFTNTATTGTSLQTVDSFLKSEYRAVDYLITIKNTAANGFSLTKVLCVHDGNLAYTTEYGTVNSNNYLGSFSAATNATHVMLQCTPVPANTAMTYVRTNLGV